MGSQPVKWVPARYDAINHHHRRACQSKLAKYILVMQGSQLLLKQFLLLIYEIQFSSTN